MTGDEFATLLDDFTRSAESGDGARFARHFTEDAVYYDYIYGAHRGRADIAHMMAELFHRDAAARSLDDENEVEIAVSDLGDRPGLGRSTEPGRDCRQPAQIVPQSAVSENAIAARRRLRSYA